MTEQEILQKHLAQFLITTFNTISEEDILKITAPNAWEHKGKRLTEGQVNALRDQAKLFRDSPLWNVLKAELRWLAYQTAYVKSKTEADQVAGKLLHYLTDVVDGKLKKMTEV